MAIDKALPNVRTTVKAPSRKEQIDDLQEQLAQQSQDPIEISHDQGGQR